MDGGDPIQENGEKARREDKGVSGGQGREREGNDEA